MRNEILILKPIPEQWMRNKEAGMCPVCGRHPDDFESRRKVFCSQECSEKYVVQATSWNQHKDKIIKKNPKCVVCGITEEAFEKKEKARVRAVWTELAEKHKKEIEQERMEELRRVEDNFLREVRRIEETTVTNDTCGWNFIKRLLEQLEKVSIHDTYEHRLTGFDVDHINPLSNGGDLWDEKNLQVLCIDCHKEKTRKENSKKKRGDS